MGSPGTAKDAAQSATGISLTPAPSATALSPLGARGPSVPLVPGPGLRSRETAGMEELGVPDRGPLLTGSVAATGAYATVSLQIASPSGGQRGQGHALPSMDMGSRMPNCLSTAMNSSTTTAMAHSSMPWMPMAAHALPPRRRAGAARRLLGRPRFTCPGQAGPRVSAGPRLRAVRRRRAGSGPVVGRRTAAERNFPSPLANFEEQQRRGPEAPPCLARAPRLSRPLCSPAGAGALGSRALPAAQPP